MDFDITAPPALPTTPARRATARRGRIFPAGGAVGGGQRWAAYLHSLLWASATTAKSPTASKPAHRCHAPDDQTEEGFALHDDGLCIGCGACVWNCPYRAVSFSARRGVTQNCDGCTEGLEAVRKRPYGLAVWVTRRTRRPSARAGGTLRTRLGET